MTREVDDHSDFLPTRPTRHHRGGDHRWWLMSHSTSEAVGKFNCQNIVQIVNLNNSDHLMVRPLCFLFIGDIIGDESFSKTF